MINRERIYTIDALKGLAILLVVLGHSFQGNIDHFDDNVVFNFIYSFHMPLFMFLAGTVAVYRFENPVIPYSKKEVSGLGRAVYFLVCPGLLGDGRLPIYCANTLFHQGNRVSGLGIVVSLDFVFELLLIRAFGEDGKALGNIRVFDNFFIGALVPCWNPWNMGTEKVFLLFYAGLLIYEVREYY